MRGRKVYGQSQEIRCPFCGEQATVKNLQGLPTCTRHREREINLRCACGGYLDVKDGKYGTFFTCFDCGPVSWAKAWEINDLPIRSWEDL